MISFLLQELLSRLPQMLIRGQLMMFRLAAFLSCIAVPTSASTPSCAVRSYFWANFYYHTHKR